MHDGFGSSLRVSPQSLMPMVPSMVMVMVPSMVMVKVMSCRFPHLALVGMELT